MFARSKKQTYQYSADVRSVLLAAQAEAARYTNDAVGAEHIALGLLSNPRGAQILDDLGVRSNRARKAIEDQIVPGRSRVADAARPYSSEAKDVLATAIAEARDSGHVAVALKHILIGLTESEYFVGETLRGLGLAASDVRGEVRITDRHGSSFAIRIDDETDLTIFQQIIAQVTQAVAVGSLTPGERLPSVRDLADQLDIAPGTVARAYEELEQKGVVVTAGSKGTVISDAAGSRVGAKERADELKQLLRPVAVSAFHLGASSSELRSALDAAMADIYRLGDE